MVMMMMAVRLLRIDAVGFQDRVDRIVNRLRKIARIAGITHTIDRIVDGVFNLCAQIGKITGRR